MNIIIIADDKVGYSIAENLGKIGESITLIDKKSDKFNQTSDSSDVRCIKGNGISATVLTEADVQNSDLLIAASSNDEHNMVACLTAKKLGAKHTLARIFDADYADELARLQIDLDLDAVINPEQATALEIEQALEYPPQIKVRTFAKGRARMIETRVTEDMPICGITLQAVSALMKKKLPRKSAVLIVAVLRGGESIIPRGNFKLQKDDKINVIGKPANIFAFCKYLNLPVRKIKKVLIVGGGNTCYYLAKNLEKISADVTIMENDEKRSTELSDLLPSATILNEDGSDIKNLNAAGVGSYDGFVSLTALDEENFFAAILALKQGVPKCVARMSREFYKDIVKEINLVDDALSIISPREVTAEYIFEYASGIKNAVDINGKTLYNIIDGELTAVEFIIDDKCEIIGEPLKLLHLSDFILLAVIVRRNEALIPAGDDVLKVGDSVIVFAKNKKLNKIEDIFYSTDLI